MEASVVPAPPLVAAAEVQPTLQISAGPVSDTTFLSHERSAPPLVISIATDNAPAISQIPGAAVRSELTNRAAPGVLSISNSKSSSDKKIAAPSALTHSVAAHSHPVLIAHDAFTSARGSASARATISLFSYLENRQMGALKMLSGFDRRRAVADWRDEWLFQIWRAAGDAAQRARADLERDLPNAGLWSVYAGQSAFAHPRVDRSMRRSLSPLLERIRALAGPALQAIDPALGRMSVALWQTDFERLLPQEPADIPEPTTVEQPFSPAGSAVAKTVIGSAFAVGARLAFGPPMAIAMGVHTLADVASPAFRHWLLDAGCKRLSEVWIGGERASQTVTTKLSAVFDETFIKAREVLR